MSTNKTNQIIVRGRKRRRGVAMMVALALTLCLTMVIIGVQLSIATQFKTSREQRDYDRALNLAEAGANSYLNFLANGSAAYSTSASLDLPWTSTYGAPAMSGSDPECSQIRSDIMAGNIKLFGTGTTNTVAGTAYSSTVGLVNYGTPSRTSLSTVGSTFNQEGYFVINTSVASTGLLTALSYGYSNGIVRRVKVTAYSAQGGNFAVYGINTLTLQANDTIDGSIGTDGTASLKNDSVTGTLFVTGAGASATIKGTAPTGGQRDLKRSIIFPTVTQIAAKEFPTAPTGLPYLALNNDNASCATIISDVINQKGGTIIFEGKPGGANYYLTNMTIGSNTAIEMDNAKGPITIWVGPGDGASNNNNGVSISSNVNFTNTGTSATQAADDPVRMYVATAGGFSSSSNMSSQYSVYCYDTDNKGNPIGNFTLASNITISQAQVTAYNVSLSSNDTIIFPTNPGVYTASEITNYQTLEWSELP